jgi:outer membrane receptor protein involved in Fe transport
MHKLHHRFLLPCLCVLGAGAAAQDAPTLPEVRVIGTTPLPEGGVPLRQVPAAVQTLDAGQSGAPDARTIADQLEQHLGGVQVQSIQGNPNQPDVSFRGFTASPVLGTAQGLSVYMDGVRMNQPFGDVVSWDLIPKLAIGSMTLMPGSNPLFGLNTLGGALSLRTKDGIDWPGTALQFSAGSYGRRALELEHGFAQPQGLDGYFAANLSHDEGWRDTSPSDLRQVFGKLGWQDARTRLTASVARADNELWGNGLQDQQLLQNDWSSVYTTPDITKNRSTLLTFTGRHELDAANTLSGNLYWRSIRTNTVNGDVNGDSLDQSLYQPDATERAALAAAGYTGFPASGANAVNTPFPFWRCVANVLLQDQPAEQCNGLINRGSTEQSQWGGSALLARHMQLAGRPHQLSAGLAYDASHVGYQQSTQLGFINPDRSVTGVPAFADGASGGTIDGVPFDNRVDLQGRTSTASVYASDTLTAGDWHWTAAGRYNRTQVRNTDLITPAGDPSSLTGSYTFARFNPALGVAFAPGAGWTAYAGYNEGTRTPSTIELACANPDQPCRLPNAMAGDPPLRQVVTRTFEAGLRGRWSPQLAWNASVFRADSADDIQFIAAQQAGFGYFQNVGRTRRQGVELGLDGHMDHVTVAANLTFLQATYRSALTLPGTANSSNSAAAAGTPGLD